MRTIAIVNQKGGCGKTTTAINLAALYARRGLRTLLIDMDPQAHCAVGLGVPTSRIEYSIGEALLADHTRGFDPSALAWEVSRNLHLAPSTVMLTALEAPGSALHRLPDKDRRLESLLNVLQTHYDRCLIDCPPMIGLLTFNALRASRETLIPLETGYFALRGAENQWATIQRVIAHIGRPIACHMLATLHDPESRLSRNLLSALKRQFAGQILPVIIHEHEELREAASFGQPVIEYAPQSAACRDFEALADWLEDHAAPPCVEIEVLRSLAPPVHREPQGVSVVAGAKPAVWSPGLRGNDVPAPDLVGGSEPRCQPTGSRAAELARRVHHLAAQSARRQLDARTATQVVGTTRPAGEMETSSPNGPLSEQSCPSDATPVQSELPEAESLQALMPDATVPQADGGPRFGVEITEQGVRFIQPGPDNRSICVAGDFNHWSAAANPLSYNEYEHMFETFIPLPPGTYQYRLVVDGRWLADPYNERHQLNSYGEPNSMVAVPDCWRPT